MIEPDQGRNEEDMDPYTMFIYSVRSPYTKESYFRKLRRFFDGIDTPFEKSIKYKE
ncbi:MAG: hypothetical protein WBP64_00540 [Nitrososphaeraceae archaeon]